MEVPVNARLFKGYESAFTPSAIHAFTDADKWDQIFLIGKIYDDGFDDIAGFLMLRRLGDESVMYETEGQCAHTNCELILGSYTQLPDTSILLSVYGENPLKPETLYYYSLDEAKNGCLQFPPEKRGASFIPNRPHPSELDPKVMLEAAEEAREEMRQDSDEEGRFAAMLEERERLQLDNPAAWGFRGCGFD